ncbi:TetR/AcrR family transcriptional regulator [Amycolatopsis sp. Poz14]|uniref:TetR/AcrR family transcriptional regulator n=1 Tax=Amycolatopsis sp. Poz14 TaxID=1447705 RepID=UPI001EE864F8|nr:TetR/AcrR family transcriptional regulator [Amycolatopsis sp. Poz14]MCG3756903.1 TetR/AcrR family transcriptional regulator [Amycolatopsis sp. Poz14]
MGNREDLLAGAKRCLIERGWGNTTVRDIAAAAGVSHAAIGYHFGSRDALLTQALVAAVDELGGQVADSSFDLSEQGLNRLIDSFGEHRALWVAQLEALVQAERSPDVRRHLVQGLREARAGVGGAVQSALVIGLMVQWLLDPEEAPSAKEVTDGIRAVAAES